MFPRRIARPCLRFAIECGRPVGVYGGRPVAVKAGVVRGGVVRGNAVKGDAAKGGVVKGGLVKGGLVTGGVEWRSGRFGTCKFEMK